jgi:hypothetical protein
MAPEQAQGQPELVGPAADVYGLGAILYELLTGRPPFKAATPLETTLQVLHEEPVPPRRFQLKVPADLETICLKCLHKEPAKRYATAEALAEDLRRFTAGEPIHARPTGTWERGVKWAKRRPAAAALVVVSTLAALSLVIGGVWSITALQAAAEREGSRAKEAKRQQALAAAHLQSALDVLGPLTQELQYDYLAKNPELAYFRGQFLGATRKFYQELLADKENPDPQVRRGIGRAFYGLGMSRSLLNERSEAQTDYLQAVALQEQLVQEFPGESDGRLDLALTYQSLGDLQAALGREEEAATTYQKIVTLFESLPSDNQRVRQFALPLARKLSDLGKYQAALLWQNRVIDWLETLRESRSDSERERAAKNLPHAYFERACLFWELGQYAQAAVDFDRALEAKLEPPLALTAREYRAFSLAKSGEYRRATAEAAALAATTVLHLYNLACLYALDGPAAKAATLAVATALAAAPAVNLYYELACIYALAMPAARQDNKLPADKRERLAEEYAAQALALLAKAHAAGSFKDSANLEQLKKDPDLNSLRSRDDFKKLLTEVEKQAQPAAK